MEQIETVARHPGLREDLDSLDHYEVLDGQRIELQPGSILCSRVTSSIVGYLGHHLLGNPKGQAVAGMRFRLLLSKERVRRPDVAFVSTKAIAEAPSQPGSDNAWNVLPDLMVEVISPHDLAEEIIEKINEYFTAGCKLVWVIYPTQRLIYVYESPRQPRIRSETDELDGGVVLPDFRIRVATLFPG